MLCAFSLLAVTATAQDRDEQAFLRKVATDLGKFARATYDAGFPGHARRIWQEVLQVYDTDDVAARSALGFARANGAWMSGEGFEFAQADNPDSNAMRNVERRWATTAKQCGNAHKARAKKFAAAGRTDRAQWHFTRVLRFLPDDREARAGAGLVEFHGLVGSELERRLYDNSRQMDTLVAVEKRTEYPVTELGSTKQCPILTKAGIAHRGVKTEHFTIWSNFDPSFLKQIAQLVERSHSFCSKVFAGEGFNPPELRIRTYIFLASEPQYKKALQANSELFRPDLLKFLLEHTAMCDLGRGADRAQMSGDASEMVVRDLAVRWPVQQWGGMRCDALNEGLGHAVVARFLGSIHVFSIDMESKAHTVSSSKQRKVLIPDVDAWRDMAIEAAYSARGTPLAKLPLLSAADFPSEARIRAWSFCDYLLRRGPSLLLALDGARGAKNSLEAAAQFQQRSGVSVDTLEREWRDFWTGATPVLRKLRAKRPPFGAASKDAAKWLGEFNAVRARLGAPAVTWDAAWSQQCKQHADYLRKNRNERGADAEQTQRDGLLGATELGRYFAQMALIATKGAPKGVLADWLHLPGYRDALLHPGLTRVGLFAEGGIVVIDALRGVGKGQTAGGGAGGGLRMAFYPLLNSTDAPVELDRALLDARVDRLLGDNAGKVIGYPISLHTWRGAGGTAACRVSAGGKEVEGLVDDTRAGANRRSAAPGLLVFYPFSPLPRKARVEVEWTLGERKHTATFMTR